MNIPACTALTLLALVSALSPRVLLAAEAWGGSAALTSDYLVRGISRSNQGAALQADLHVASDNGLIAGIFASTVQFDSGDHRGAEFSGFAGHVFQPSNTWRTTILASYYAYQWNSSGSQYNYTELGLNAVFDDWLEMTLVYSPDSPHYVSGIGLERVSATSADITVRTPWRHRLAASAGLGYSQFGGSRGSGYAYQSVGGILDLAPWSLSLAYVNTTSAATALFFNAAAHNQWDATLIFRF